MSETHDMAKDRLEPGACGKSILERIRSRKRASVRGYYDDARALASAEDRTLQALASGGGPCRQTLQRIAYVAKRISRAELDEILHSTDSRGDPPPFWVLVALSGLSREARRTFLKTAATETWSVKRARETRKEYRRQRKGSW